MTDVPRLMLTHPDRHQLLTVQEFAALARLHPKTIYRRIKEGRQPGFVDIGGREYRIDAVKALAAMNKLKGN